MAKVLIIAGNTRSLLANRADLIQAIQDQGHTVYALVPEYDFLPDIEKLNISWETFELNRMGLNPLADLRSLLTLYRYIRGIQPDKVFAYSIKPVLYGILVSRWARVSEVYVMITGLGYVFVGNTPRQRMLRAAIKPLYSYCLRRTNAVFFQNPDDKKLLNDLGVLKGVNPVRTHGSGVHLERYPFCPIPPGALVFLVIARLLTDKGLVEFVEAASYLKSRFPQVRFQLLGPHDINLPHAVSAKTLEEWRANPAIELLGHQQDVRPYIRASHVSVLPSYREGTPRSVLEAMSMGRPIITTDVPGCRETVIDGRNGYLVPAKNSTHLAAAMEHLITNPDLVAILGKQSRILAEEKYDVNKVNHVIMHAMGLL